MLAWGADQNFPGKDHRTHSFYVWLNLRPKKAGDRSEKHQYMTLNNYFILL